MKDPTDVSRRRLSGACHCSAEEKHVFFPPCDGCIIHWSEESGLATMQMLLMSTRAVSLPSCIIKSSLNIPDEWICC